jgi:N-acetylglutamate synthase-like GNAT family acetyltransferase
MSGATVRTAAALDQDAVGALINGIQRGEFAIDITLADQPDLADIDGFYRKGAGDFWVAEVGGDIAGTIALIDIGGGLGALRKMFVAPAFRGREHGIAKKLLDVLLDHARAQGLAAVYLGTTAKFLAAHRFYEKNGFDLVEETDLPESFPRMAVDTRFYRISL